MVAPDRTVVPSPSLTCSELVPMYVTVSVAFASVPATPADAPEPIAQTHSSTRRNSFDVVTIVIVGHESRKGEAPVARPLPLFHLRDRLDDPCRLERTA